MDDTLFFDFLNASDSGDYFCKATNELGSDEINFQLNVLHRPISFDSIEDVDLSSVPFDKPVTLTFNLAANPQPQVDWFHRRPEDDNFKLLKTTNSTTLGFPKMNKNLDGLYKAVATNDFGSIVKVFELNGFLNGTPTFVIPRETKVTVQKGDNLELTFEPSIWDDTMDIEFTVDPKENLQIDGNKIIIKNATKENIGTLSGIIRNKFGEDVLTYELDVQYKPVIQDLLVNDQIVTDSDNITVKENSTLRITCPTDSNPEAEFIWSKDGEVIEDEVRMYVPKI